VSFESGEDSGERVLKRLDVCVCVCVCVSMCVCVCAYVERRERAVE